MKRPDYSKATEASLGLLRTAAQHGIVRKALIGPHSIVFATQEGWRKTMLPPNSAGLQSDLMEMLSQGGCSDISTLPESLGSKMVTPLLTALPFVYLALVYKMLKGIHNGSMDGGDFFSSKLLTGGGAQSAPRASTTMFVDVAGLDDVLPEIRDVVTYLQHPSGYHALGAEPPRGILLHGNPGNGKTLLAKAVAGEADCDAFVSCSGSEFVEMYVGRGAARIRSLFQEARKVAARNHAEKFGYGGRRYGRWLSNISDSFKLSRELVQKVERPPTAIIFIDELDALAKSRSSGLMSSNDERDQTLNQLLTEMDGFCSRSSCRNNNDFCSLVTIIVIAATNRPEVLDPAILRRFDRQIFVHAPNSNGRQAILKIHAAKTNCRFSTIHWEYLADQTHSFSGSDLKQVVNDAALLAVRQKNKYVEQGHLIQAIQRAKATKVQRFGRGTSPASGLDGSNRENEPPLLHPFLWNGR
jgi:cell division protease FtsH